MQDLEAGRTQSDMLITRLAPIVVLTSHASILDRAAIEKLADKSVEKFTIEEIPLALAEQRYRTISQSCWEISGRPMISVGETSIQLVRIDVEFCVGTLGRRFDRSSIRAT